MKLTCLRLLIVLMIPQLSITAQSPQRIDVHNASLWQIYNRQAAYPEKDKVELNAAAGDGLLVLKNGVFGPSVIEFDMKGEDKPGQSFVGLAFNVQEDRSYEVVYFRPFNFLNADTVRRSRAVQYVYMPNYPWEKLRNEHPGVFENRVKPVPDPNGWFHVKLVTGKPFIEVFVNGSSEPCLRVASLSQQQQGKIALWVGNGSKGNFSNLTIAPLLQQPRIAYGNNPQQGKYFDAGDARLYYEVYGNGKPVLLLHGGVYGYIDEFEYFINELSKTHRVICLATRGHGKSGIGKTPFTWQQRADDAWKLVQSITTDSVIVLGFSDGAAAGFKLAATHPAVVKKLIAIGFGDNPKGSRTNRFNYTSEQLLKDAKGFFEGRIALMPEQGRWNECLGMLNKLYNDDFISKETFEKIRCPVLLMGGDSDDYHNVDGMVQAHHYIAGSRLSIIPGCGHVVFFCNYPAVWESIKPFVYQ